MRRLAVSCLALAAVLALTSCGGDRGTQKEGLFYEASGISPDAVLLTVDGRDIPAERYLYWLTYICDYIAGYYDDGDGIQWEETLSGETLEDYAKNQALENTVLYATVENWAEEYGCSLTDEDRTNMDREWEARVAQYGGEKAYLDVLADMGLDRTGAEAISADYYLYSHLYDLYCAEDSVLSPGDGELEAYAREQGYLTVDHIWISTAAADPGDAEAYGACRAKAEEAFSKLNASTAPLSDFAVLAATYSDEADREQHPEGRTFRAGDGTMPEAFEAAAKELEENQWSGIVEADDGFYIILRKPLNLDAVSPDYFDALLQAAAESAEVTLSRRYEELSASGFYSGLISARAALAEAAAGE